MIVGLAIGAGGGLWVTLKDWQREGLLFRADGRWRRLWAVARQRSPLLTGAR